MFGCWCLVQPALLCTSRLLYTIPENSKGRTIVGVCITCKFVMLGNAIQVGNEERTAPAFQFGLCNNVLTSASPSDRQRIQAFIRRSEHSRFTPPDLPSFAADDNLFNNILNNSHHVLHHLLPPPSQHYTLRSRRHNLQLSITSTSLIDKNFLPRMLHMDSY